MNSMKTIIQGYIFAIFGLLVGFTSLSAAESKTILMLVTGADQMPNGEHTGLWLEEFAIPYKLFTNAGYQVEVVTPQGGTAPIDPRSEPTLELIADWQGAIQSLANTKPLEAANSEEFDAIFIPGGHGVMFDLATDPNVSALIQQFYTEGKPIASVCHGPAALVNVVQEDETPLVEGKKMTAFSDAEEQAVGLAEEMPFLLETKLIELGAKVKTKRKFKSYAVKDGNLITGQNPASSKATAKLLMKALSAKR